LELKKDFWENKYTNQETGWDTGGITTPLKTYIDGLKNKELSILIPGAGNGHEAEYLFQNGIENVDVIDLASLPLLNLKSRVPDFPESQLIQGDFFELDKKYDLILEQTFFCALDPALRPAYAKKMSELLNPKGKLAGVLFDFALSETGPPFGGSRQEYLSYFKPYFKIKTLEKCYNSIKPRMGNELFIIFEKP
jgi:methyl halide transferase